MVCTADLIGRFEAQLREHIRDEEGDQFPRLRTYIPREKLVEMGRQVETAKKLAPTRPHPSAPHSELFRKTVGPGGRHGRPAPGQAHGTADRVQPAA